MKKDDWEKIKSIPGVRSLRDELRRHPEWLRDPRPPRGMGPSQLYRVPKNAFRKIAEKVKKEDHIII